MQKFSIGAVSRLTQIPTHTLRKWETRHNIAVPVRTDTGRRMYTEDQVEQLRLIKQLVDKRHALSQLADMDLAALRDLLGLHHEPESTPISSVTLVGHRLHARLTGEGVVQERFNGDLRAWLETDPPSDSDALVVEIGALTAADVELLAPLKARYDKFIVVFKYGNRTQIAALNEAGIECVEAPVDERALLSLLNARAERPDEAEAPRGRFSTEELARVAALSPGLACECPNHIAKLLIDINAFEAYSMACEDSDPAEQALHEKLAQISAQARALFEDALVAVAVADGLELKAKR